ncbi:hypothetical protein H696_03557 [Fonticula alba]|uniref:Uncharacterized protein n=1 Tax=Fonticula alba TaxID=691883 RepID=A0A058Z762_FONAL|nr:hypothetical protein H696_03557 [Fonticula alba]KCV70095.1 hypothetical protein H696_03557 [Fonticula alba]|eukprot:XP_009495701.1 hypothetical protein H696_03557 [Fonticula alba]
MGYRPTKKFKSVDPYAKLKPTQLAMMEKREAQFNNAPKKFTDRAPRSFTYLMQHNKRFEEKQNGKKAPKAAGKAGAAGAAGAAATAGAAAEKPAPAAKKPATEPQSFQERLNEAMRATRSVSSKRTEYLRDRRNRKREAKAPISDDDRVLGNYNPIPTVTDESKRLTKEEEAAIRSAAADRARLIDAKAEYYGFDRPSKNHAPDAPGFGEVVDTVPHLTSVPKMRGNAAALAAAMGDGPAAGAKRTRVSTESLKLAQAFRSGAAIPKTPAMRVAVKAAGAEAGTATTEGKGHKSGAAAAELGIKTGKRLRDMSTAQRRILMDERDRVVGMYREKRKLDMARAEEARQRKIGPRTSQ